MLEIVGRHFHFVLVKHIAVGDRPIGPSVQTRSKTLSTLLQIHGDAFQTVGDLTGDRAAFQAADLLEIGELRDFHAVQPDLPAQTPGAQRRRFPVVLDEADVVYQRIDAQCAQ